MQQCGCKELDAYRATLWLQYCAATLHWGPTVKRADKAAKATVSAPGAATWSIVSAQVRAIPRGKRDAVAFEVDR